MIKINKIGINNLLGFNKTIFEFQPGITYIFGNNQISKKLNNSNGAGKSGLFSSMSELLFDEPIQGSKADRNKTGTRFIEFEKDNSQYKILSKFTKGKEKITIVKEGKSFQFATNTKAKNQIQKIFTPSFLDFTSYIFIDSRSYHPLVRGSSADRKRFFTKFFQLHKVDIERKLIQAELSALAKDKAIYNELLSQEAEIKNQLISNNEYEKLVQQHEKLTKTLEQYQVKAQRSIEVKRLIDLIEDNRLIDVINKYKQDLDSIKSKHKRVEKKIEALKELQDISKRFNEYRIELKKHNNLRKKYDHNIEYYKRKATQYIEVDAKLREITYQIKKVDYLEKPEEVEQPKGTYQQVEHKYRHLKNIIENPNIKDNKCITCGQLIKNLNQKEVKKEFLKYKKLFNNHVDYDLYLRDLEKYNEELKKKKELLRVKKELDEKLPVLKEYYEAYNYFIELGPQPTFKNPKELKIYDQKIIKIELEILNTQLNELSKIVDFVPQVKQYLSLTKEDYKLAEFDLDKLHKSHEELRILETSIETQKRLKNQYRILQNRKQELEKILKNEISLKLLLEGYNDKTMKRTLVNKISGRLMQLVNYYGSMFFHGFKFDFKWDKSNVSILATRPNGDVSDVRRLSGAESALFSLTLILALAAFLPSDRRCDTLILDEPDASFSRETSRIFQDMLPILNKIFPKIVIITPKSEEQYENAYEYTVIRTKEGAKLERGRKV